MAIKDIVTRGYGPSEVKFVPTRGYASSATPPPAAENPWRSYRTGRGKRGWWPLIPVVMEVLRWRV